MKESQDPIYLCQKCGSKRVEEEMVTSGQGTDVREEPCLVCQVCGYIVKRLEDEKVNDMQQAEIDGEIIRDTLEQFTK